MAVAGVDENSLEYTPTWVVALVCFSILFISIAVDRFIRCAGQRLKDREWWPLVGGSRKMKDELMLLGLISLLLTVFQTGIGKICISERLDNILLPCKKPNSSFVVANFNTSSFASDATRGRRLHSVASHTTDYCSKKGKVALLSVEALHQLDIFIFVLATFHVVLCVLKVLSMIIQWRRLEIYDRGIRSKQRGREVFTEIMEGYKSPLGSFRYLVSH
ncbi:MLO-like protein 15 [Eucalyptus grandis]|uniref:MLO-like protein 15 n=1 Tax=Eucalyptus grandis TaxID=71139 RepID=UPI00192E9351|nr:MLO-like protein 15 [Eucalyptus grandis]